MKRSQFSRFPADPRVYLTNGELELLQSDTVPSPRYAIASLGRRRGHCGSSCFVPIQNGPREKHGSKSSFQFLGCRDHGNPGTKDTRGRIACLRYMTPQSSLALQGSRGKKSWICIHFSICFDFVDPGTTVETRPVKLSSPLLVLSQCLAFPVSVRVRDVGFPPGPLSTPESVLILQQLSASKAPVPLFPESFPAREPDRSGGGLGVFTVAAEHLSSPGSHPLGLAYGVGRRVLLTCK